MVQPERAIAAALASHESHDPHVQVRVRARVRSTIYYKRRPRLNANLILTPVKTRGKEITPRPIFKEIQFADIECTIRHIS